MREGRRQERLYGATQLPNFLRRPHGPGWALVGDAGCHKDPLLALGVCDALRDAGLLADAVSGSEPIGGALHEYERRRNEATMPDYQLNLELAKLQAAPPEAYALRAALRGNQEDTNSFFRARQGLAPRESFFNEENMARVMGGG